MKQSKLIINRPKDQSHIQWLTGSLLTVIAWLLLVYAFIPLIDIFCQFKHLPLFFERYNITNTAAWWGMGAKIPYWGAVTGGIIAVLYGWAFLQIFRFKNVRRTHVPHQVQTAEIAVHCGHAEKEVKTWASARRSVAHYDDKSKMTNVALKADAPFRANPRKDEPPAPTAPLACAPTAGLAAADRELMMTSLLQGYRKELIRQWSKVESFEAIIQEVTENKRTRDNPRDVVLYAEIKRRRKGTLMRIKQLRQRLAEGRFLLEEQKNVRSQLRDTPGVTAV
ncbi:MAG: poly-beta-1,6-N-acetyl-D-glucosamine biosynthesis protein PgaD [Agitococcus sp.]|nr:poly-beta-1,6-N-acetyl-D-glucosamine biosynthesis protein PgaD [Agitococcus sp.]